MLKQTDFVHKSKVIKLIISGSKQKIESKQHLSAYKDISQKEVIFHEMIT
jgi:hypothetical protein